MGDFTDTHNSTELLRRLFKESAIGVKCIYINHLNDTRSVEGFSTHNPLYKEKLSSESGVTFVSTKDLSSVDVSRYDVIGVDESQFFDNLLRDILHWVDDLH